MLRKSSTPTLGSTVPLIAENALRPPSMASLAGAAAAVVIVVMGCCTNLLDLYKRLGVGDKTPFHRAVLLRDETGRRHDLWGTPGLPAPLHLSLSLLAFSALSITERILVVQQQLAMLRLGKG